MRRAFILIAILALALQSEAKWSKSKARKQGQNTGNSITNQLSESSQKGQSTQLTDYDSLYNSSRDTVDNSQKGQAAALVLGAGLGAAAATYGSICGGGFTGFAACVSATILAGMAMQANKSADSFDPVIKDSMDNSCTYSSVACGGGPTPNPYTAALTPDVINPNENDQILKNVVDNLSKGGFEIDPNSGLIKTPKGNLNMNDRASLASALGEDGLNQLMSKVKGLEKDAKAKVDQIKAGAVTAALGFEGGGGGSIGEVSDEGYDLDADGAAAGAISRLAKQRKPAQAKGLTKNFNGDPIGVAADSIFEMMSRRYQLKNNQKTFFGPEVQ